MWNPVTIYTVLLVGQRLQIAPVPPSFLPFVLGLVMHYFCPRLPNQLWLFPWHPAANMLRAVVHDLIFPIFRFGIGLYKGHVGHSPNSSSSECLCLHLYFEYILWAFSQATAHPDICHTLYTATCNRLYLLFALLLISCT